MFDVKSLTLGEIDRIEELSGRSIDSIGDDGAPKGKMLAAMVFVMKRREHLAAGRPPSPTDWNDALGMTMVEANAVLGITKDEPQDAPAEPEPKAPGAGVQPPARPETTKQLDSQVLEVREDPQVPEA
ncbi:MAG TPA: hypothetical protein VFF10_09875 [Trueperaceae bacterium]|nr:hypothetical protein [Trueperaceae bacterium]